MLILNEILIYTILSIVLFYPIPILVWYGWLDYLSNRSKGEFYGMLIMSIVPILGHLASLIYIFDKSFKIGDNSFLDYQNNVNIAYKCDSCKITSRAYQFANISEGVCPKCNDKKGTLSKVDDGLEYPFAPLLNTKRTIKILLNENKTNKLKDKIRTNTRIEKELEAYEKLQMKKLQELEAKANEIRAELAKSGVK